MFCTKMERNPFLCTAHSCGDNQSATVPRGVLLFSDQCLGGLFDLYGCVGRRGGCYQICGGPGSLTQLPFSTLPIIPWGWRGGWLLETHRLNKTPCWDRKPIDKPPCIPCDMTEQCEEERNVCRATTGTVKAGHLISVHLHGSLGPLLSLLTVACFSLQLFLSLSLSAIMMARCIVHFFPDVFWFCWNCRPQKVMTFCRLEEKSLAECCKPSIDFH